MTKFRNGMPKLKQKLLEEFDKEFSDNSQKLSTGQPLLKFKIDVNYYIVKSFFSKALDSMRQATLEEVEEKINLAFENNEWDGMDTIDDILSSLKELKEGK